jgi:GNAT superfamily N-acetyltransferase
MDMLVALYKLQGIDVHRRQVVEQGITVRRALAHERKPITDWVTKHFGAGWAGECATALSQLPATCLVATRDGDLLGFACFDVTAKGFFGPTGVAEDARGQGIGAALLAEALLAMRAAGYAYAIVGGTDESLRTFYEKVAGAVPISGSEPGIYAEPIKTD